MTEFAYSIEFNKNLPDHKLIVVFFLCLWFVLFLLVPNLWWLSAALCSVALIDAKQRLINIMPVTGVVLIQENESWLQLNGPILDLQGDLTSAHRYANWLVITIRTEKGTRRLAFIASAMDKVSWSHLNRIALSNH
ncbi:hypothetical protein N474_00255 [Pseudoalteromonas luteoviolacea CPMOR-2]|uniref:hypothetical protein n=1 Tax=Pseudoalteromonas luteoviolacea TaxID=43657 RepID=UPI0007B0AAEF|nr:hypothetical protein [Pseudoalteromonas luteoviolacea]KZN60645.1 hypothetical protein N474_00255 [Pseudoalteromonas luteoviolacea CPMOR-2]